MNRKCTPEFTTNLNLSANTHGSLGIILNFKLIGLVAKGNREIRPRGISKEATVVAANWQYLHTWRLNESLHYTAYMQSQILRGIIFLFLNIYPHIYFLIYHQQQLCFHSNQLWKMTHPYMMEAVIYTGRQLRGDVVSYPVCVCNAPFRRMWVSYPAWMIPETTSSSSFSNGYDAC